MRLVGICHLSSGGSGWDNSNFPVTKRLLFTPMACIVVTGKSNFARARKSCPTRGQSTRALSQLVSFSRPVPVCDHPSLNDNSFWPQPMTTQSPARTKRNRFGGKSFFNSHPFVIFWAVIFVHDSRRFSRLVCQS